MIETGHVLKLDQEHLETVIPAAGGEILVVGGKYKGKGVWFPGSPKYRLSVPQES